MVMSDRFTCLSFHSCQVVLPSLRYNCFKSNVDKSNVKFRGEVKGQGHTIDTRPFSFFVSFFVSCRLDQPFLSLWSLIWNCEKSFLSRWPKGHPVHFPRPGLYYHRPKYLRLSSKGVWLERQQSLRGTRTRTRRKRTENSHPRPGQGDLIIQISLAVNA